MLSQTWLRGFQAARAASMYSDAYTKSKRMGASLWGGSVLLSLGYNRMRTTHPLAKYGVHAEIQSLLKRRHYEDRNCVLYVYRETADGKPAMSRPCPRCLMTIKDSGVTRVRYYDAQGVPKEMTL